MLKELDVAIIGGGLTGLSIAYNLSKRGVNDVAVFERERVGYGASSRNAGGIRAQFSSADHIELARDSREMWSRLSRELGFNIIFVRQGYLFLASNEEEEAFLKENVKTQNSLGVNSRYIGPDRIREIVPQLNTEKIIGGSYDPDDGSAHPFAAIWAYSRAAQKNGVKIFEHTEVKGVTSRSGRAHSIVTERGETMARVIVNAAGAYSHVIARSVGVHLPLSVIRREILVTEPLRHFLKPLVIHMSSGFIARQTLRGEVISSTRMEDEPESFSIKSSLRFIKKYARDALTVFPQFRYIKIMRQWAGNYDVTPDGSPILGEVEEVEGFIQANGFSGHGFMLTPIVGELIADAIITGKTPKLIEPFKLIRFKTGKLIVEKTVAGKRIAHST
ncbi:MAG: NAD(P)/FAD-dependent oxidoreductase [Candidatus Geothermarchaeales archaeon]